MFKIIAYKYMANKSALKEYGARELEMFVNPFEGLLQLNHVDAPQLAGEWDCAKVSG